MNHRSSGNAANAEAFKVKRPVALRAVSILDFDQALGPM
jgi:hypothetical protein